ncbi:hypothetical protein [Pseudoalteromonas ruthenica]|uniref:Uncharacterized protein n=1 Tax=Pseudoalteromonas ruthenica TaxID=151081 RepID=A0A0F4Q1T7_9GAMM|nr:hypothetical protein [Pseudoalteromonas ruthenica]KJY97649.1 hypothetical protein TW76_07405 [Pseudoalteromonas ruthenica]KJZ01676.1 hypothetical protein TW72_01620 [Pseudoalteromonas ruthenica]TMO94929.1 hypothetical protein CWC13_01850 [Pseudoalteromonas ruthenica]TMO97046.1 hypothetical protein CWC07_15335 [Pseudoalteromonas ruthenica]TMP06428.1 hypothetical protein CWC09_11880 [Pseudoalteromonas ruthenica]
MSESSDVEIELAEFNLDRMHPTGKTNLIKVAELMGRLDTGGWMDYIDNGSLDLKAIATELEIARSSLYQNEHIKQYVLSKAEALLVQGLIIELPYQTREKASLDIVTATERYSATDKEIREKNAEIKRLQLQVAELSANLDGVKSELRVAKNELEKSNIRSHHLALFGRYPR